MKLPLTVLNNCSLFLRIIHFEKRVRRLITASLAKELQNAVYKSTQLMHRVNTTHNMGVDVLDKTEERRKQSVLNHFQSVI